MTLEHVSTGDPHVAAHNEERDAINELEDAIPLLMPLPQLPQVGEVVRWNGTEWIGSTSRLFEGEGQPEGVVAAPIGSTYVDTAGLTGAVRWIKTRGVDENDNTGWTLEFGDTGWRNIAGLLTMGANGVVNAARLRRINNQVDIYLDLKMSTNTSSPRTVWTLPAGFRPDFNRHGALQDNNEAAAATTQVLANGDVNFYTITAAKTDRWNGTWMTDAPWPASLPGTVL